MGTNFYTLDDRHIGKMSGIGRGRCRFCWRTGEGGLGDTLREVRASLERRRAVIDEYGYRMTRDEFYKWYVRVVHEVDELDTDFC